MLLLCAETGCPCLAGSPAGLQLQGPEAGGEGPQSLWGGTSQLPVQASVQQAEGAGTGTEDCEVTSMTSHGWSTSLRVGGMCTVTWDPLGEGVAARAMRDTRAAMLLADSCTPR